ncbi:MAG: DUF2752 domain-containing protein [Bacteroidia bacterium]|nr:DUF2752 domain-containing protein [Bacteroidia bacterium]
MNRRAVYSVVLAAGLIGYLWLAGNLFLEPSGGGKAIHFCLFKSLTGLPCPACGTTRAVTALVKLKPVESIAINPLGLINAALLIICPLWVAFDLLTRKRTFYERYKKAESVLKKQKVFFPLILLIVINWIWSITKNL